MGSSNVRLTSLASALVTAALVVAPAVVATGSRAAFAGEDQEAEFDRRVSALQATDVNGRLALADFCVQSRMPDRAARLAAEAWALSPTSKPALELLAKLDYHVVVDRRAAPSRWWVDAETWYPDHGFVKQGSAWLTPRQVASQGDLKTATEAVRVAEKTVMAEKAARRKVESLAKNVADLARAKEDAVSALDTAKENLRDAKERRKRAEEDCRNYRGWSRIAVERKNAEADLEAAIDEEVQAKKAIEQLQQQIARIDRDPTGKKLEETKTALEALATDPATMQNDLIAAKKAFEEARAAVTEAALEARTVRVQAEEAARDGLARANEELARRR